jgi:ATP-dependent HslUV protease ATP-binding subunit HslU
VRWGGQTYRAHEASRESIELAFDAILQEKMKVRAKYGFRPPRTGRKTDAAGDDLVRLCHTQGSWRAPVPGLRRAEGLRGGVQPRGFIGNIVERLEPSVPSTTVVNDGSIFAALGLW